MMQHSDSGLLSCLPYSHNAHTRKYQIHHKMDRRSLNWIDNQTNNTVKLTRWCPRLSDYAFDDVHRAGIKQQAAYALSCLQMIGYDRSPLEDYPLTHANGVIKMKAKSVSLTKTCYL